MVVTWASACRQLERFLTTPPLVRETSRYNVLQQARQRLGLGGGTPVAKDEALAKADKTFSDIILAPEVKHSVRALAASAANTRLHGAPFRHYLLYGVSLVSVVLLVICRVPPGKRHNCSVWSACLVAAPCMERFISVAAVMVCIQDARRVYHAWRKAGARRCLSGPSRRHHDS